MSIFGTLIPSSAVEAAVLATCDEWMETYLAEVERQQSMMVGMLARWRSTQTSYEFENWPEGQLPALVAVAGTMEVQERGPIYIGQFAVQVGVLVEDSTEALARRVTQLHQAAIDGILIQHPSLGGFASETLLVSRETHLPNVTNRTVAYAESTFHVLVDGIVGEGLGPQAPPSDPDQPQDDWPTVQQADIQVTPR